MILQRLLHIKTKKRMTPDLIAEKLKTQFGDKILEFAKDVIDPVAKVAPEAVYDICKFLKDDPELYFDMCHNLSGYDLGAGKNLVVICSPSSIAIGLPSKPKCRARARISQPSLCCGGRRTGTSVKCLICSAFVSTAIPIIAAFSVRMIGKAGRCARITSCRNIITAFAFRIKKIGTISTRWPPIPSAGILFFNLKDVCRWRAIMVNPLKRVISNQCSVISPIGTK